MSSSPVLGELLDLLRVEGFAIGVDDHVRVGRLLALEIAWSEAQLRSAVRSVIAKDAQERVAFDAVWRRLFVASVAKPLDLTPSIGSQGALSPAMPERPSRRPSARRLLAGLLAGVGAVVVTMVIWWQWPAGGPVPVPPMPVPAPVDALVPVSIDAPVLVPVPVDAPVPVPVPIDAPATMPIKAPVAMAVPVSVPTPKLVEVRDRVGLAVLLGGGVLLTAAIAIGGMRARRRRRFIPGPWQYSLQVPAAPHPVLDRDDVLDGAAHLTSQADREATGSLDVDRSVHVTVATGGASVLVYRPPPAAPRYLVLEDRAAGSERWRFLYDELLRGLAREGVDVTRYTFVGDPSSCTSIDGLERRELRDLVEHCDALMVVGDGDAAFDPIEGAPAGWLQLLHQVPRRLWLNPVPEARWSRGAQAIARDTPMEHAIARGLAALQCTGRAGTDRKPDAPGFPRVIEQSPDTPIGFAALGDHVGPAGMRAMAAVAMVGAPLIAVLRWLVEQFRLPLDEATWLRVATLPWFGTGTWPEGLQPRLVTWLQATDVTFADAVAKAAAAVLVEGEPAPGSAAHLRWELDLAAARARAGDRAAARAAMRKVGETALHREVARWISGSSSGRADWSIPAFIILGAALCVVGSAQLMRSPADLDCEVAVQTGSAGVAVIICQREYERTRAPADGVRLAEALLQSRGPAAASAIANDLLATDRRSDALRILGEVAFSEKRLDKAFELLHSARDLHRKESRRAELAKDARALARCHLERDQFTEALSALDECVAEASAASDRSIEGLCRINAARVYILVGNFKEARLELGRATPLVSQPREVARLWFERGNVEQAQSRGLDNVTGEAQAVAHFEKALEHALRGNLTDMVLGIELNLIFSLAETGRPDEAERHLAIAAGLDRNKDFESERTQLAARIAYRRGNLTLASSLNEQVYPSLEADYDRFEICVMQARIALASKDPKSAEKWARRGIEEAEQIRASQTAVGLRSWVLGSRRAPYELLFSILARAARFEEAVVVFDQWQGRTFLDMLARPGSDSSLGLTSTARMPDIIQKWLPMVSVAPLMTTGGGAVVEALRTTDLFALAVAEDVLWRVTASQGRIRIDELGKFDALQEKLDRFRAMPTDRMLAGELGEHLLPAELFRDKSTLHVVLDARLVTLPVVALRRGGQVLIAARPVLHLPRLPAGAACIASVPTGGATVLADASGDLPEARRESDRVAALFKTKVLVGAAATSAALFAAKSDSVLHVAVHAEFGANGGILKLYDRDVSASEISAARLGPPLVVLATANTARAYDPELYGSLSNAFLVSGSTHVIATLRPVSDSGALELTSRFYTEGGVQDPVRTLAAIQAKLADGDNKDWPMFAVFGREACAPSK